MIHVVGRLLKIGAGGNTEEGIIRGCLWRFFSGFQQPVFFSSMASFGIFLQPLPRFQKIKKHA
jgi:hypothetical protein